MSYLSSFLCVTRMLSLETVDLCVLFDVMLFFLYFCRMPAYKRRVQSVEGKSKKRRLDQQSGTEASNVPETPRRSLRAAASQKKKMEDQQSKKSPTTEENTSGPRQPAKRRGPAKGTKRGRHRKNTAEQGAALKPAHSKDSETSVQSQESIPRKRTRRKKEKDGEGAIIKRRPGRPPSNGLGSYKKKYNPKETNISVRLESTGLQLILDLIQIDHNYGKPSKLTSWKPQPVKTIISTHVKEGSQLIEKPKEEAILEQKSVEPIQDDTVDTSKTQQPVKDEPKQHTEPDSVACSENVDCLKDSSVTPSEVEEQVEKMSDDKEEPLTPSVVSADVTNTESATPSDHTTETQKDVVESFSEMTEQTEAGQEEHKEAPAVSTLQPEGTLEDDTNPPDECKPVPEESSPCTDLPNSEVTDSTVSSTGGDSSEGPKDESPSSEPETHSSETQLMLDTDDMEIEIENCVVEVVSENMLGSPDNQHDALDKVALSLLSSSGASEETTASSKNSAAGNSVAGSSPAQPKKQAMNPQARTKARLAAQAEAKAAASKRAAHKQLNLLALCEEIADDIASDTALIKEKGKEKEKEKDVVSPTVAALPPPAAAAVASSSPSSSSSPAVKDEKTATAPAPKDEPDSKEAEATQVPVDSKEPPQTVEPEQKVPEPAPQPEVETPKRRFFLSQITVPLKVHEKKKLSRYQRLRQVELQRDKLTWTRVKKLKSDQASQNQPLKEEPQASPTTPEATPSPAVTVAQAQIPTPAVSAAASASNVTVPTSAAASNLSRTNQSPKLPAAKENTPKPPSKSDVKTVLPPVPPPRPNGVTVPKARPPVEYKPYTPRPKYSADDFVLDGLDDEIPKPVTPSNGKHEVRIKYHKQCVMLCRYRTVF